MLDYKNILKADSCAAADALDRLGVAGVVPRLRRVATRRTLVGPLRTVSLAAADSPGAGQRHLATASLQTARPGEVLLIANAGRTGAAAWGGLLGRAAANVGVAGVVVDGACRDIDELEALQFPAFARGTSPSSARGRFVETAHDSRVTVDDLTIAPGDWVVADGSGTVFIAQQYLAEVDAAVAEILGAENEFRQRLADGQEAWRVLGERYEGLTGHDHD